MKRNMAGLAIALCVLIVVLIWAGCTMERSMLFYPTHHREVTVLTEWRSGADVIGYAREVVNPKCVWLLIHGNAGQAADRVYALPHFPATDSVYILEYPGYGQRSGTPSQSTFDAAAVRAYGALRNAFPHTPVAVFGESIGSGPACLLSQQPNPPEKIVLVVPFDELKRVAADHFPRVIVSLLLRSRWNNGEALSGYKGPVEIYGARDDTIIPVNHARALAALVPQAKLVVLPCGHNDWSRQPEVIARYP